MSSITDIMKQFDEFREACETFFKNPHKYQRELRSLLTANFELIGCVKSRRLFMDSRLVGYFAQIRLLSKPEGRRITYCCC